ncbi:hypothetical protein T484DRAFT_1892068, partial [Baffinella frigidus]
GGARGEAGSGRLGIRSCLSTRGTTPLRCWSTTRGTRADAIASAIRWSGARWRNRAARRALTGFTVRETAQPRRAPGCPSTAPPPSSRSGPPPPKHKQPCSVSQSSKPPPPPP